MPPPAQAPAADMSDEGKELYEAAKGGDKARVQELIQKGVDVDKWKDPVSVSGQGSYGLAWRWWELGRGARVCVTEALCVRLLRRG